MRRLSRLLPIGIAAALTLGGCGGQAPAARTVRTPAAASPSPSAHPTSAQTQTPTQKPTPRHTRSPAQEAKPLRGVVIALDPGHQLGNRNHPQQINRLVRAGGFEKPCNTTGTATDAGFPEATLNFDIARAVRRRLMRLGAVVPMTRTTDSDRRWGPCVDVRGQFGQRVHARLLVSIHADGAAAEGHGFHVIVRRRHGAAMRLAEDLRAGLDRHGIARSTYVGGGTGLSVRSDLATLNLARVPVAMVEVGNMRNPSDAARMTSRHGRDIYAAALVAGIRAFLDR